MLSAKDVLSRVEEVKNGQCYRFTDPCFLKILCNDSSYLYLIEIDERCSDDTFPMILEHSNYVMGIVIDEHPKRGTIIAQLIHDLLEKKPYLQLTLTHGALSWVVDCKFRLRNICVYDSILENLHGFGELLQIEGNEIEFFTFGLAFQLIIRCFVSYFEHPNCRVRQLTVYERSTSMTMMFRNTLIRRIVSLYTATTSISLPYKTDGGEFDTMLHLLCEQRESLPDDLWRVIFYFLYP